jgi:predicted site-specific integrase-resolvase
MESFYTEFDVEIMEVEEVQERGIEEMLVTDMMSLIASSSGKFYKVRLLKQKEIQANQ